MVEILFFLILVGIIYPFTFYPLSLFIISQFYKDEEYEDLYVYPSVTFIVSAYNEEKSIRKKIENIISLDYDRSKMEVIIASDGSTDRTNDIVRDLSNNIDVSITLLEINDRKGKTNVQNKAVSLAKNEFLVFSDANSVWKEDALKHLMNTFTNLKIGYVCGKLEYINTTDTLSSNSEGKYWNFDLMMRKMESNIYSIVGGNGAIYAIRKEDYHELPLILSHDGFIPSKLIIEGKLSKYNEKAVAYEKAGENVKDEFNRKVRMQRGQPWKKYTHIGKFNFFKTGWFSYFYFGHKYLKYLLYLFHPLLLILNFILAPNNVFFRVVLYFHVGFYLLAFIEFIFKTKIKFFYFPYYYLMTIYAQIFSVYNTLTGKTKATWEKAESTR